MKPLAVITGVGPGTGAALVRRFHQGGYRVAMLARNAERLQALAQECPAAFAVPCDVAEADTLHVALKRIEAEAGPCSVVVHNAVGGAFGNFLDIDPAVLDTNFQVNVMAFLHLARWAAPQMKAAGYLCNKAQSIPSYVHHRDRLTSPLGRRACAASLPSSGRDAIAVGAPGAAGRRADEQRRGLIPRLKWKQAGATTKPAM